MTDMVDSNTHPHGVGYKSLPDSSEIIIDRPDILALPTPRLSLPAPISEPKDVAIANNSAHPADPAPSGGTHISVDEIIVPSNRRSLNEEAVNNLAKSMGELGQMTQITVHRDPESNKFVLDAGAHRLAATKALGKTTILAQVVDWPADKRRKWEIAENLHRAELTELERAEQIAEWVNLVEGDKPSQSATVSKGGRGNKGGAREAARQLGLTKDEVHRTKKLAGLSDEAKQTARETGLDNNQTALLGATKADDPAAFLKAQQTKRARAPKAKDRPLPQEAKDVAKQIYAKFDEGDIPALISLMEAAKMSDVITALRELRAASKSKTARPKKHTPMTRKSKATSDSRSAPEGQTE